MPKLAQFWKWRIRWWVCSKLLGFSHLALPSLDPADQSPFRVQLFWVAPSRGDSTKHRIQGCCQTRTFEHPRQVSRDDVDGKHSGPALKSDSYFMGKIQTLGAKKNSVFIMLPSFRFCMLTTGKPSQMGNTSVEKNKSNHLSQI